MIELPVDQILPEVLDRLQSGPNLVIEAPPGAGKTTRVPAALLRLDMGGVVVLEPRRIAARMAARRVSEELGERPGETVGYQVRFEEVASQRTRLRFVTEGVLTRHFLSDPLLKNTGIVVLDEFHERHIETDLALALLRRLQRTSRPELRIVVMSATLDVNPVAQFLDAPVLRSEGRLFATTVEYTPHSGAPLEEQVAAGVRRVIAKAPRGHVLVFLPGAAEIRSAARLCEPVAHASGMTVAPLHGDLPPEEQDRAVAPCATPKLILATNIAESSITIDGVAAVVDTGLARIASDDPWTGLPSLDIGRVSRASCRQRAGRAGRTGPGHVVRLYTEEDFARRPEHDAPEISRRELSHLLLDLHAMGARAIDWLTPPPAEAVASAQRLLERLDAVDEHRCATQLGREMARLPLHPRLSRLALEADRRRAGETGCAVAAALSAGERLEKPTGGVPSDLLALVEREWSYGAKRAYDQIRRAVRPRAGRGSDDAVMIAVLAAFPDRVARRRQGREYQLSSGMAILSDLSSVQAEFIVAADIETRRDRELPLIRLASAIQPEWLIDLFPDRIEERAGVEWNRSAERVDRVSALLYDGVVIEESRSGDPDPAEAAALLARMALERDIGRFIDRAALDDLSARSKFAAERGAGPALTDGMVAEALTQAAAGLRSFDGLERSDVMGLLRARLSPRLEEVAPARVPLRPGGRMVRVHYAEDRPPWIESRLQDFFGLRETPRVGGTPVVAHLLAPNNRPVQTTSDLAGFWERLYPQVRRQLSRRYPKHKWPEKPG